MPIVFPEWSNYVSEKEEARKVELMKFWCVKVCEGEDTEKRSPPLMGISPEVEGEGDRGCLEGGAGRSRKKALQQSWGMRAVV